MSTTIIITICILLLLAYIFDISSAFTKIPSVILLLVLGGFVKQVIIFLGIQIPDLQPVLPVLGTIGLILIVLEGALELEINKGKLKVIKKSFLVALLPMLVTTLSIAYALYLFGNTSFRIGIINAIPFCVISSAIAIPSVRNLTASNKEFVVYESSFSDILGVLFFNFFAFNEILNIKSYGSFALQILIMALISFISVLGLSFLLGRIKHHITYTPIILLVIIIYMVSKVYHLPGLIFILIFGLFLGNFNDLKNYKWIDLFRPEKMKLEVEKFKNITYEATFLVRALFFLLFGYLMEAKDLFNLQTLPWAMGIVSIILIVRWILLKLFNLPISPLLLIAPRGLITILLFLTILPNQSIGIVNSSLIIQTIIISVLAMMFGIVFSKKIENPS